MRRSARWRMIVVGALVAAMFACNGGQASSPAATPQAWSTTFTSAIPATAIEIQMVGYRYVPSDVTAQPGKVVFDLVNPSSETYAHNVVITDRAGKEFGSSADIPPGTTAIFTVDDLPPGSYMFASTLEGIGYSADGTQASHGMVGRLTVLLDYKANSSTVPAGSQPAGSTRVLMSDFQFSPSDIRLPAGKLAFYLVSPRSEALAHNMVISDAAGRVVAVSANIEPGSEAVFSVEYLPAGQYQFESTLGGPDDPTQHYQADAGMVGTLTLLS